MRLTAVLPLLLAVTANAQQRPLTPDSIGRAIDSYVIRLAAWGFSGAVAVQSHGRTVLAKGYGWADSARGVRNTPTTVFDLGSVSKQFTSTAAMTLVDAGKLDLSAPITRYLDSVPADKAGITVHQLLTHTSGLPREVAPDFVDMTRAEFERAALNATLVGPPGGQFSYSNTGYRMVAAIVERVSGVPFTEYLRQKLFAPSGMMHTGFYDDAKQWRATTTIAVGDGSAVTGQSPATWKTSWGNMGSGSVVSTAADMLAWNRAIDARAVLTTASWKLLFTPQNGAYGYGWNIRKNDRGTTTIQHEGRWYAYSSDVRRFPDDSLAIIVLSNRVLGADVMAPPVAAMAERVAFGKGGALPPAPVALRAAVARACGGEYRLASGDSVTIGMVANGIHLDAHGGDALLAINGIMVDPATRDSIRARAERTRTFFQQAWQGEFTLLRQLASPQRADRYAAALTAWKKQRLDSLGAMRSIEIVGALPTGGGGWRTFVRLVFERGSEGLALGWGAAGTIILLETENPALPEWSSLFRQTADGGFAAYDFGSDATATVRCGKELEIRAGGQVWKGLRVRR